MILPLYSSCFSESFAYLICPNQCNINGLWTNFVHKATSPGLNHIISTTLKMRLGTLIQSDFSILSSVHYCHHTCICIVLLPPLHCHYTCICIVILPPSHYCQSHHIIAIIPGYAMCYCHHHIIAIRPVSTVVLPLSHYCHQMSIYALCYHHDSIAIIHVFASCYCHHHTIAIIAVSALCYCHHHIVAISAYHTCICIVLLPPVHYWRHTSI